mmetsp:Transcript_25102/g.51570  ORF Transcript_25102/g.51570 Transcript_25102/m.51570 type:complete len:220 (+) Transcript_25102:222-881(+)
MRWHRAMACTSFCGFQSLSKMMHVSAAHRLMPTPPARVESRNTNASSLLLKRSMACWRFEPIMDPSRRSTLKLRYSQKSSRMFMIRVIWEKISTLWPSRRSLGRSLSSNTIFPEERSKQRSSHCFLNCESVGMSADGGELASPLVPLLLLLLLLAVWASCASRMRSSCSKSASRASTPSIKYGWLQHFLSSIWMFMSFGTTAPRAARAKKAWFFSKMAR